MPISTEGSGMSIMRPKTKVVVVVVVEVVVAVVVLVLLIVILLSFFLLFFLTCKFRASCYSTRPSWVHTPVIKWAV